MRLPPGPRGPVRFAMTLAIAGTGGWVFARLGLPLPWMLGSMTAVTAATLLRAPVHAPPAIRPPMAAIIGVMLGATFHPGLVGQLAGWIPTLVGLALFSAVAGLACAIYLRRVAGFDPVTAYFAGMPGGLVEMIEIGGAKGGDEMRIALIHSARILTVVFAVPFLVQWVEGVSLGARPASGIALLDTPLGAHALLVLCAVAGMLAARLARLPAPDLLGPMAVSGVLHVTGLTTFVPSTEIIVGAQIVLGAVLGARFARARPVEVLRILAIAVGMTAILLALVVATGLAVARLTGVPLVSLILAYAPGGLAEMSLVALAIGADVAFVAAHHLARVILVMVAAPLAFTLIERAGRGRRD